MGWYHKAAKDIVDICIAIGKRFEINGKMKLFEKDIVGFVYVILIHLLKISLLF